MIQKSLNQLASEEVGKSAKGNWFFVSLGSNVQMVTSNGRAALKFWEELPTDKESMLECNNIGIICDNSPRNENSQEPKELLKFRDYSILRKLKLI